MSYDDDYLYGNAYHLSEHSHMATDTAVISTNREANQHGQVFAPLRSTMSPHRAAHNDQTYGTGYNGPFPI